MTDFKGKKTAVALGNFDGLHKGHIAVIKEAVIQKNNGLLPCIVTFKEHPQYLLKGCAPKKILSDTITAEMCKTVGLEIVKLDFSEVKDMQPEDFFCEIIIKKLNAAFVCCGFNYRFGKDGKGNADVLQKLCRKNNIAFCKAKPVEHNGDSISSTRIRKAIKNGEIKAANEMLGFFFSYNFKVVEGDKIGAKVLGFPTINQYFPDNHIVPKNGVYASAATVDGKMYPAMTNIGTRPTVGGTSRRSETCIIGFSGDLYGTNTKVMLIDFLREEKKFTNIDSLKEQIQKDCEKAKEIFKNEVF